MSAGDDETLRVADLAPVVDGRVTIRTADHGTVVLDEPSWCAGVHRQDGFRADIVHQGEDDVLTFEARGAVSELLTAFVTQRPFSADPHVYLAVDLDGDFVELDPPGVDRLAAALTDRASQLRHSARRLAVLRGGAR
ncbi:hypothetical protein AB0N23_02555 [Streptomyces sp. NPDC052644]